MFDEETMMGHVVTILCKKAFLASAISTLAMSKARPITMEDLQRWTAEAGMDLDAVSSAGAASTANNTVAKARPVTLDDLLGDGVDESRVDYQHGHDTGKNNAFDSRKQRGQRLGYGAKKRVKPWRTGVHSQQQCPPKGQNKGFRK